MPQLQDNRFKKSVIYLCGHDKNGAMGIIINKPSLNISFTELLIQLDISLSFIDEKVLLHQGGPLEENRGFILHSTDYMNDATIQITNTLALTATIDVLKAIALGRGPSQYFIALGYAGWGAGQLENEFLNNSWLTAPADEKILFSLEPSERWEAVMLNLGINSSCLTTQAGHA
jgi:putative transcriptional regulator